MAVVITGVGGNFNHGASCTASGSGFLTKSPAAPRVWDNCSGTNVLDLWDGAWPDQNATYNLTYRVEQRGIPMPHGRTTKYLAGCHYSTGGSNAGYTVMGWKNRTIGSFPQFGLMSFKYRADDNWDFTCGSPCDDNLKHYDYSTGTSPYDPTNWYISHHFSNPSSPASANSDAQWVINDDGTSLDNPDQNGHNFFWGFPAVNPWSGQWAQSLIFNRYTDQNDGNIIVYENGFGSAMVNYLGPTDQYAGTARNESFGGYARNQHGDTQWRYFADVYLDDTWSCVILTNASTLDASTKYEMQIPSAWADGSVTFTVNLGAFGANDPAWLYVIDSNGSANATGFPVTLTPRYLAIKL